MNVYRGAAVYICWCAESQCRFYGVRRSGCPAFVTPRCTAGVARPLTQQCRRGVPCVRQNADGAGRPNDSLRGFGCMLASTLRVAVVALFGETFQAAL